MIKKILAIMALVLGVFLGGSAAAQPTVEPRPVDERACAQTEGRWQDVPGPAQPGLPHDQDHEHHETGEELECHHAIGTEDPNPNP